MSMSVADPGFLRGGGKSNRGRLLQHRGAKIFKVVGTQLVTKTIALYLLSKSDFLTYLAETFHTVSR